METVPDLAIRCSYSELRETTSLTPHPRNPNQHGKRQIEMLAKVIQHQGWRNPIVVSARSGFVIAGHGRLSAALLIGCDRVPVDVQEFATEADEWAHLVADNRIAELADMDEDMLGNLLQDLASIEDFDIENSGFDKSSLDNLLGGDEDEQPPSRGLVEEFGAAPFSVFDARSGQWQERKKAWIASGIASESGREGNLAFNLSSQPQEVYAKKAEIEKKEGAVIPWKEFADRFPELMSQTGTSIFDPVLTELLVRWFCPAGGRVLDPFAGGSVRGLVSARLGMSYTGVDLRSEQVQANFEQAQRYGMTEGSAQWLVGDSRMLPSIIGKQKPFDFMLSCPPYFDLEEYSDMPEDLSRAGDYQAFLKAYEEIIGHACSTLADDSFACWVIGDVRDKNGWFCGLVGDTVKAFERAGMRLYNDAILLTQAGSLPMRARKSFEKSRKLGKTHQYVLVFAKGNAAAVSKRCTLASIPPDEEAT